jgi:hypothetical protein
MITMIKSLNQLIFITLVSVSTSHAAKDALSQQSAESSQQIMQRIYSDEQRIKDYFFSADTLRNDPKYRTTVRDLYRMVGTVSCATPEDLYQAACGLLQINYLWAALEICTKIFRNTTNPNDDIFIKAKELESSIYSYLSSKNHTLTSQSMKYSSGSKVYPMTGPALLRTWAAQSGINFQHYKN